MSISWLAPAVLLGTALVAVPIAIHLLVRQQGRRVAYPSLRFVSPSALAAFRRRNVQDAALLACRMAIIVAVVLALAGPVLQTEARSAAHGSRVARAVIVLPGTPPEAAAAAGEAFVSRAFTRANLDDAIADAVRWLGQQPPASREVLFTGTARRGQLTSVGLQGIPTSTGIRFATTTGAVAKRDVVLPSLRRQDGALVLEQRKVHLADDATRVAAGPLAPVPDDLLRIEAAPEDRALADAAVRAALEEGVRWSRPDLRVLVVWEGADAAAVQRVTNGATLIRMSRPQPASSAASAVIAAVEQVTAPPTDSLEPVRIDEAQLRAWSRAPGAVPADARPADEGDRRWFWALALALLALEHVLRRAATRPVAAETAAEARVA